MAFLVGDAAMRVSFRAGRGLNTGIKGAVSLAFPVAEAIKKKHWRHSDFAKHAGFMAALQEREVSNRSLDMMKFASAPGYQREMTVVERIRMGKVVQSSPEKRERLKERVLAIAKKAFAVDRLPSNIGPPDLELLRKKIDEASEELVSVLYTSGAWNTWEVGGPELHPLEWHEK